MPVFQGPKPGGDTAATERPGYSTVTRVSTVRTPSQDAEVSKQFTLADVDPIGRWEGIIVGRPGSGKTVMAGTFPGPFRWIAADGPSCIKSLRWAFKEGKTSITRMEDLVAYTPVEVIAEGHYAVAANAFNKMTDMVDYWFSPGQVELWEHGTLVLDSASQINEWAMNLGLNVNGQFPTANKPLSGSHAINMKAKLKIITGKQDYKSAMALFEGFISDIRTACAQHDRNLLLLCHEWVDEETNDETGSRRVTAVKPALYGQLRDTLPKSFDDVWYQQVYNGKEFKTMVHANPTHDAKTRWGACLNPEEPADYRWMIGKVKDYHSLSKAEFEAKYKKSS